MICAIDFDGTLCVDRCPEPGDAATLPSMVVIFRGSEAREEENA